MSIESISNLLASGTTTSTAATKSQEIGRDDFLKMFLAQLNHQDPLNPMDGTEFASQLAQFSSLEQLFNVNENLESMKSSQDESGRFQGLEFIGKEVVALGKYLSLNEGESTGGGFVMDAAADCTVQVKDLGGNVVRTISMGSLEAGEHFFQWDGQSDAGADMGSGVYQFEIIAQRADEESVSVTRLMTGLVERVNLEGTESTLYLGDVAFSLSNVLEMKLPKGTDVTDTGTGESSTTGQEEA
jgi:flagellar basal-body rod modification protein FlgD